MRVMTCNFELFKLIQTIVRADKNEAKMISAVLSKTVYHAHDDIVAVQV
jgi:hypothetical protein